MLAFLITVVCSLKLSVMCIAIFFQYSNPRNSLPFQLDLEVLIEWNKNQIAFSSLF